MSGRDLALSQLTSHARRFPQLRIRARRAASRFPNGEGERLARAIEHAAVRQWLSLRRVIQSGLSRPWDTLEPGLQGALLGAASQMLLLDGQPSFAVVDHAVNWVKAHVRPKAGGLANAVLRRLVSLRGELTETPASDDPAGLPANLLPRSDGRAWQFNEAVFSRDSTKRLAQQTSHPLAAILRWQRTFGVDRADALARHNLSVAPVVLASPDTSPPGAAWVAHEESGFYVCDGPLPAISELLGEHPSMRIQDTASAAPVELTRSLRPRLIVDYCAGRGTKTRQLAELHPGARVLATDIDADRLESLVDLAQTYANVEVMEMEQLRQRGRDADLLVLDVPCSNSGVLARRVEARYRLDDATLRSLIAVQRQIMADALPLLGERGSLLYATCSIEPEENEQQMQWLTHWHPLTVAQTTSRQPAGLPGEPISRYRDGGYAALLRHAANQARTL